MSSNTPEPSTPSTPGEHAQDLSDRENFAGIPAQHVKQTKKKASKKVTKKPKVNAAAALLVAKEKEKVAAAKAKRETENEHNLYYLRCPVNQHHHGAYLTEHPRADLIHPGMWFSIEHSLGDRWIDYRVCCQECLVDGDSASWLWLRPKAMPDGQVAFIPYSPAPNIEMICATSRSVVEGRLGMSIADLIDGKEVENAG